MGGNALFLGKKPAIRLNADEFAATVKEINVSSSVAAKFALIPSYRNKPTFGDADFLYIPKDNNVTKFKDYLKSNLLMDSQLFFENGPVISLGYKTQFYEEPFQLDFIRSNDIDFNFSYNYFSYNDCGNLIGRIARGKFGLVFGHAGLFYHLYDEEKPNHLIAKICISKDFLEVIKFLGFEVDCYLKGFNDLSDIFEFVIMSKYFNPEFFNLETRNHAARSRDKKRVSYMKFLEVISSMNFPKNEETFDINYAMDYFPGLKETISITQAKYRKSIEEHQKFNGTLVASHFPELQKDGRLLGKFMREFKEKHDIDLLTMNELFDTMDLFWNEEFKNS